MQRTLVRRLTPRMLLVALTSVVLVLSAFAVSWADLGSAKPVSVSNLSGDTGVAVPEVLPGEILPEVALAPVAPPTTGASTSTTADSTTTTARAGDATTARVAAPPCKTSSPKRPCPPPCSQSGSANPNGACPPPCAQPASPPNGANPTSAASSPGTDKQPSPATPPSVGNEARPACPPPCNQVQPSPPAQTAPAKPMPAEPAGPNTATPAKANTVMPAQVDPAPAKCPPPCYQTDPAPPAGTTPASPGNIASGQPANAPAPSTVAPAQPIRACPPPCYQYDTGSGTTSSCPQPCPAYATTDGKPAPCPPPCNDTPPPNSGSAVGNSGVASMCAPPCYYAQSSGAGAYGSGVAYSCPPPACAYPTEPDGGIGDARPAVMIYCPPPCEKDASCPQPCYEPAPMPDPSTGEIHGFAPVPPSRSCPPPPCQGTKTCPPPCPSAAATDRPCTSPCSYPGGDGQAAGDFAPCPAASGVEGRVTAGPTCPVERPDEPCPPKGVETTVQLVRQDGSVAARTRSAPDGTFKLAAAPGSYRLVADWPSRVGGCAPVDVTVERGRFTHADVACDTGIR